MKKPPQLLKSLQRFQAIATLAGAFAVSFPPAHAGNGTWNVDADGSWNTPGNWVSNTVADGAGFTADFTTVNITANRVVDIDTTSRTLGALLIGDTTLNQNYTITSTTGKTLTFNNNGSGAVLTSSNGGTPTFSVPFVLADNLTITKTGNGLSIGGGISGTGNLDIKNNSTNSLSISNNATLIDNVGTLTNSGTGATNTVSVSAKLGSNLTSVIQNSSSSSITFSSTSGGFAGSVSVLNGVIAFTSQTGLNSSNTVSVSAGGTFQVGSNNPMTIAGLSGSGGTVQGSSTTAARSLILGGSDTYSYSGSITDNSAGVFSLTKATGGTQTLSGTNTYTGNTTVTAGTLVLGSTGELAFMIGANGVNNSIGGSGILTLDGKFNFDLTGAAATGSWNIVDVGSLQETFSTSFAVVGFTDAGSDTWTKINGGSTYTFDEATGLLTAIPEPGTWALLAFSLTTVLVLRRRRNS